MLHLQLPALHPRNRGLGLASGFAAQAPEAETSAAVLITGCCDVAAVVRGCRAVLPRARLLFYGEDLGACVAAAAAGAEARQIAGGGRDALVRRFFAEVDADAYVLAHDPAAADAAIASRAVAEVAGGKDFVDVRRFGAPARGGVLDQLLGRTVDFAFGGGSDILDSDLRACSRRFALSYRRNAAEPVEGDGIRDIALHALRMRLPIGRLASLTGATRPPVPLRGANRIAQIGLVVRLLAEERPRRAFGLLGLGLVLSGLLAAAPNLRDPAWHAGGGLGARILVGAALSAAGIATGAVGLILDAMAAARQEVGRLGIAALSRSAERGPPAADAGGPPARRATSA